MFIKYFLRTYWKQILVDQSENIVAEPRELVGMLLVTNEGQNGQ